MSAQAPAYGANCQRTVLPNGIRVITETLPYIPSATLGIWVAAGSRHDPAGLSGQAHLLEHVLFRNGLAEDARLAALRDGLGGHINAFTSYETCCFYASMIQDDVAAAAEVLGRLIANPVFSAEDVERERAVILAALNRARDAPNDAARELATRAAWGDHPMVRPILGEAASVRAITPATLLAQRQATHVTQNIVIAAAGNLAHEALVEEVSRWLDACPAGSAPADGPAPVFAPGIRTREMAAQQVHFCLVLPGLPEGLPEFAHLNLLAHLFGGTSASRLGRRIREELGLAYQIQASASGYTDGGLMFVQTTVAPGLAGQCLRHMLAELARVLEDGFEPGEIEIARKRLITGILLGMENTRARMVRMARVELRHGCLAGPDLLIDTLSRIDAAGFNAWVRRTVVPRAALGALGPAPALAELQSEVATWARA